MRRNKIHSSYSEQNEISPNLYGISSDLRVQPDSNVCSQVIKDTLPLIIFYKSFKRQWYQFCFLQHKCFIEQQAAVRMIIYRMDVAFQSVKILMDMFHKYRISICVFLTFLIITLEVKKLFCKGKQQNAINSPAQEAKCILKMYRNGTRVTSFMS